MGNAPFAQVVVYPEGNTGNGTSLAAFKAGAFSQGVPVQPVTIQYSNPLGLDLSWCEPLGIPVHVLALSMLVSVRCFAPRACHPTLYTPHTGCSTELPE